MKCRLTNDDWIWIEVSGGAATTQFPSPVARASSAEARLSFLSLAHQDSNTTIPHNLCSPVCQLIPLRHLLSTPRTLNIEIPVLYC
jgi:hypothetical protein